MSNFYLERFVADTQTAMHYLDVCLQDECGNTLPVNCLFDSGTQMSVLREEAVNGLQYEVIGRVELKGFDNHETWQVWTLGGPVYIEIVLVDLDLLFKVTDPFSCRNSENKYCHNFVISGPILTKLHRNGLLYEAIFMRWHDTVLVTLCHFSRSYRQMKMVKPRDRLWRLHI